MPNSTPSLRDAIFYPADGYSNAMLYQTDDAPWLATQQTALLFSIVDRPDLIDEDATLDVLLEWATIDPYNFWVSGAPITVQKYEGPDSGLVDVYKIVSETYKATGDAPAWVEVEADHTSHNSDDVAVPIVEADGTISFYSLDDLGW